MSLTSYDSQNFQVIVYSHPSPMQRGDIKELLQQAIAFEK